MGFFIDYNMYKLLPMLKKGIWYKIRDEKGNWHFGIAPVKKGEAKFKWRKSEYYLVGTPEYEISLGIKFFEYLWDCPFPINIDPNAPNMVAFREQAATDQIVRANEREIAYAKAKLLFKKDDKQMQMILYLILGAVIIAVLMSWQIMNKLPK